MKSYKYLLFTFFIACFFVVSFHLPCSHAARGRILLSEPDGSPSKKPVYEIQVPNGTLTEAAGIGSIAVEPAQTPASQVEAEAGTEAGLRSWSPVRIWQAILAATGWTSDGTTTSTTQDTGRISYVRTEAALIAANADSGVKKITPMLPYTLTAPFVLASGKTYAPLPGAIVTTSAVNTFDLSAGHLEDNGGKMFSSLPGEVFGLSEAPIESWGALPNSASYATQNTNAFKCALYSMTYYIGATKYIGGVLNVGIGDFYIDDEITADPSVYYIGSINGQGRSSSIIQTNAAKSIFNFQKAYRISLSNLMLSGGISGLIVNGTNVDENVSSIDGVHFSGQTSISLDAQSGFTSSELNVKNCTFSGAATFISTYCDYTNILQSWASTTGDVPVFINHGGTITIKNLVGVPTNSGSNSCWVRNYNHAYLENNRFGSEDGRGRTVLEQMGTGASINVTAINNYCPVNDYAYKFYELPAHLTLNGNYGYDNLGEAYCKGIWVDASASATNDPSDYVLRDRIVLRWVYSAGQSTTLTSKIFALGEAEKINIQSPIIEFSDLVSSFTSLAMPEKADSNVNITVGTAAYPPLGGAVLTTLTATDDSASWATNRNDVVSNHGTAGNAYTWVIDLVVTGNSVPPYMTCYIQGQYKRFALRSGVNILSIVALEPNPQEGWEIAFSQITSGTVIAIGRIRQFLGIKNIETVHTVFTDSSTNSPTSDAYHRYDLGDRVNYTNPVSAGKIGAIVTTAGDNGGEAWKTWGLIDIQIASNTEAAAASSTSVALVPGNTYGTFTGSTVRDDPKLPEAFQDLETAVETKAPRLMDTIILTAPSGVHTTTDDSATLIHADDSSATSAKVGMMLYNVTDTSSCTVTASTATGATCTLAGGTDNNWDINDVYQFGPGPAQSGSVFHASVAGTIRHPATANYFACYRTDAAAVLTVDMVSDAMQFNGDVGGSYSAGIGAGDCIDSPATAGSYMCLHNRSSTVADGLNYRNQWEDGGAS